jgi:glycerol transport system ATP-binding protein
MASIHLKGLAHRYPAASSGATVPYALNPLDQVWDDGGAYALLGPSGCGKTTLLNIISGLVRPSEGRVLFDGDDVTDLPTEQRNIAQVFQFPVVYDTLSVADNLAFPLRNRGLDKAIIDARVAETLVMLGLEGRAHERARSLSADDKQKISLGRGLVRTDVRAILFDEPLTVIDPHLKWQLRTELKKIHERFGHTMIYVTHDQTEALTFADKVVVMDAGVILQVGTPKALFDRPRHTFVGTFIGSPGMNVLRCEFDGEQAFVDGVKIPLDAATCSVARGRGLHESTSVRLEIGIRPEAVTVSGEPKTGPAVRLIAVEDLGRHLLLRLQLGSQPLCALLPEGAEIPEQPTLHFDPAMTLLYADSLLVEGTDETEQTSAVRVEAYA